MYAKVVLIKLSIPFLCKLPLIGVSNYMDVINVWLKPCDP